MADRLAGQRVLVMGLGRFGGGAGVARFAADAGADVTITDTATEDKLADALRAIEDLVRAGRIRLHLGGHDERDLDGMHRLIVNPAVQRPWDHPLVSAARSRGVRRTTEIAMLIRRLRDRGVPVVGVTGTVGKSTVAAMIAHALGELGVEHALGGNIGGSLLTRLDEIRPSTTVVLELSSAMLWWLGEALPGFSPNVAVVTGISPNHIDWHGSIDHYIASKQIILSGQHAGDHAVLAPDVADWPTRPGVHRLAGSGRVEPEMVLPGAHNRRNAALAVAALSALGCDEKEAAGAVARFPGLPHRLESLGRHRGVLCYNDSKSTTPASVAIAVDAVRERAAGIHLIAGGADKGLDLASFGGLDLAGLYAIGQTAPAIVDAARRAGRPVERCATLDQAVRLAASRAEPGEALLLSPGCASWDQFENYERRGEVFGELVERYLGPRDQA